VSRSSGSVGVRRSGVGNRSEATGTKQDKLLDARSGALSTRSPPRRESAKTERA
jgi:hypothetical protein